VENYETNPLIDQSVILSAPDPAFGLAASGPIRSPGKILYWVKYPNKD
jgi:hypothetical protein